jgi:hypothetical protein
MACEQRTNRVSKWVCQLSSGIGQLSSKQAFYTGVAVGASGTGVGALALARRHQLARLLGLGPKPISAPRQAIARPKAKSVPGLSGSPAKPGSKPIPGLAATAPKPKPIPSLATGDPPQTKLQAAPIQMRDSQGQLVTSQNSHRVVRPDGAETGLAITPYLEQKDGRTVESKTTWGVTHTGTGALIEGPFESVAQAQGLATALAPLRWTKTPLPQADMDRARALIEQHRQTPKPAAAAKTKSKRVKKT